jgi:hypothetical protein
MLRYVGFQKKGRKRFKLVFMDDKTQSMHFFNARQCISRNKSMNYNPKYEVIQLRNSIDYAFRRGNKLFERIAGLSHYKHFK